MLSVERDKASSCGGTSKDAVDPISGVAVWAVRVIDRLVRGKGTGQVVKIAAPHAPDPLPAIPGTPLRPAIFDDMSAVPYVRDGWVSYTLWAKGMRSALPAEQQGRGKPASKSAAA